MDMDTVIEFRELGDDWYEGTFKIDGQETKITGICRKNPIDHLQSAYQFFKQGGMRAQCVFNQSTACHMIVMRRNNEKITIEVVKLKEKFENNARLGSNDYLDSNVVFSAAIALTQFADAISGSTKG
ncbi:hypothetical protein [Kaarinaea lacus]